nr:hydrogenase subunit MbhD domain-containing protein [Devosia aurantiaca]
MVPASDLGSWWSRFNVTSLTFYEWGVVLLAVIGLVVVVISPTRLTAILSLGVQGTALALIFLLFGAPDLAFTQFMVEVLSVAVLAFVMARLNLDRHDARPLEDWLRDGALALPAASAFRCC